MRSANVINEDTAATDRPPLALHTVAVATNVQPNDARPKGLHQLLSIAGVVAQIGDNQRIALIAGVNLGQRAGARTAIEALRQLVEFRDAQDSRRIASLTTSSLYRHRTNCLKLASSNAARQGGPCAVAIERDAQRRLFGAARPD